MSFDAVPYIGQYAKDTPYLFVAAGFNKWGMTSSMAAADILADLITGKKTTSPTFFHHQEVCLRQRGACSSAAFSFSQISVSRVVKHFSILGKP